MSIPPILCYHKVGTRFDPGATQVGPLVFVRQVSSLARRGTALGSAQLLRALAGEARPGDFVVTFDDGYEGLGDHAFPAIADLGLTALVFVITDHAGRENTWDVRYGGAALRHMSWDDLGRWMERGVEVHSHTATHRRLTWLPDDAVAEELEGSRAAIHARLGARPAGICYPFGAVDERVERLAARAGYTLGFAGPAGGTGALALRRAPVYAWDRFAPPAVLRSGALGALARWGARSANRLAVVTSALKQPRGPAA